MRVDVAADAVVDVAVDAVLDVAGDAVVDEAIVVVATDTQPRLME